MNTVNDSSENMSDEIFHALAPSVKMNEVVGLEDAKAILKEGIILPMKFPALFEVYTIVNQNDVGEAQNSLLSASSERDVPHLLILWKSRNGKDHASKVNLLRGSRGHFPQPEWV